MEMVIALAGIPGIADIAEQIARSQRPPLRNPGRIAGKVRVIIAEAAVGRPLVEHDPAAAARVEQLFDPTGPAAITRLFAGAMMSSP